LEGCVVGGKAGVSPFEVLAKTAVDDTDSHLKQKVCTLRRPTHLLRLRRAQSMESKAYRSRVDCVLITVSREGLILSQLRRCRQLTYIFVRILKASLVRESIQAVRCEGLLRMK
jgi:hypothetical protein